MLALPENKNAGKLEEPYATLVLFLAASGLRIGEAIAVKWSDFSGNVLHVTRRIYDGDEGTVKSAHSERKLPIAPDLLDRMRQLGNEEWVFPGTTRNPHQSGQCAEAVRATGCERTWNLNRRMARLQAQSYHGNAAERCASEGDLRHSWS